MVSFLNQYEILYNKAKADLFTANCLRRIIYDVKGILDKAAIDGRL